MSPANDKVQLASVEATPIKADEDANTTPVADQTPNADNASASEPQSTAGTGGQGKMALYFGLGLLAGLLLAVITLAYPAFVSYQFGESQQAKLAQTASESQFYQMSTALKEQENIDLKIATADAKMASLQARLDDIAAKEKEYEALLGQKAQLEREYDAAVEARAGLNAQATAAEAKLNALKSQEAVFVEPLSEQLPAAIKDNFEELLKQE